MQNTVFSHDGFDEAALLRARMGISQSQKDGSISGPQTGKHSYFQRISAPNQLGTFSFENNGLNRGSFNQASSRGNIFMQNQVGEEPNFNQMIQNRLRNPPKTTTNAKTREQVLNMAKMKLNPKFQHLFHKEQGQNGQQSEPKIGTTHNILQEKMEQREIDRELGEVEYNINKNTKQMVSKIFKAASDGDKVLFNQLLDEVEKKAKDDASEGVGPVG